MTADQRLGAKIKTLRESSGMTQGQVGKILGLHQAAICRIESGEQKISAMQLHVMAKVFDVSFSEFFKVMKDPP